MEVLELRNSVYAVQFFIPQFSSVQSLSRVQLFEIPWAQSSTPGFLVHHQLLELAQIYVHQVSDAIQPSHPWLSPSPPALSFPRFIPRT